MEDVDTILYIFTYANYNNLHLLFHKLNAGVSIFLSLFPTTATGKGGSISSTATGNGGSISSTDTTLLPISAGLVYERGGGGSGGGGTASAFPAALHELTMPMQPTFGEEGSSRWRRRRWRGWREEKGLMHREVLKVIAGRRGLRWKKKKKGGGKGRIERKYNKEGEEITCSCGDEDQDQHWLGWKVGWSCSDERCSLGWKEMKQTR
ncbi:hypothetical protein M5K25_012505 [Dendrobium thyrsiflorum]|uniref:Uncharacterized protein n=1 Tax=Dendrobium thyrsiflorum TaxID=117978 RepID=A0ABD0UXP6_DENTH